MTRRTSLLGLCCSAALAPLTFGAEALAEYPNDNTDIVKVEEPPALPPPPADVPDAPDPLPFKRRPYVGIWGGVGFANVVHPQLGTAHVYGPLLALQVGVPLTPQWSLGLEFTNMDRGVNRKSEGERFTTSASFFRAQADCTNCAAPASGGPVLATTLLLNTVGPRVDFTPLGATGPYLGATGGLAVITMLDHRVGGGGTARAGWRVALADTFLIGLEGGVQGQTFSGGSSVMGFAALSVQLALFETRRSGKKPGVYVIPQRSAPSVTRMR